MAQLIMKNGEEIAVTDNRASEIWQMLNDFTKPKGPKEREFVSGISQVRFGSKALSAPGNLPAPQIADERVREVIEDSQIKGYEKMRRISEIIRERRQRRVHEAHR